MGRPRGLLVERDREVAEIDRALSGAADGEGWLLVLEGPAGIGKTALLEEARRRADRAGLVVVTARGGELEGGFPYGVVRALLEPIVRAADHERRHRLLAGAAGLAAPLVVGSDAVSGGPAEAAFAIVHGVYWLVANLAAERPVALLVDDVHWADPPSLRALIYLARRLEGLAATLIVSIRTGEAWSDDELVSELGVSPRAHVSALAPLTEAGIERVLAGTFGRAPVMGLARSCREASAGNPFLVCELAGSLIADGIDPTATVIDRLPLIAPITIARVTLPRIARLSTDAVDLARACAVLGADARLPLAAALSGLDERRGLAALDALIRAVVIRAGAPLEFCHPIVRTAIYEDLPVGTRSLAHRQAAELLEAQGAELDTVAGHLLASEPTGSSAVVATLRVAAAHALALGALDSAASYLRRALAEGIERTLLPNVLLELGIAEKLARQPAASERFDEVRRLSTDPLTRATATIEQAGIVAYSGDWPQWLTLLDAALGELSDHDHPIFVQAEAMRAARTAYDPTFVEDFDERLPRLRGLVADRTAGMRPLAMLLAVWDAQRGKPPRHVRDLVDLGWDHGRYLSENDSIEPLPQGICALAICDELDRASEIVEAVRATARKTGSVMHYLVASAHQGWLETLRGNLTAAVGEVRDALERALELELQMPLAVTLSYCADVLLERPDVADLTALVETIELGPMADTLIGAMMIETRGRLRFAAGQTTTAITDLRHAGAISDALRFSNPLGMASWRSALAIMLGPRRHDEAITLAHEELADARRSRQARRIGVALRALGLLEPDAERAQTHLDQAVTILGGSPARLEHARSLVELGAARRRRGDRAAARPPLRDGLDLAVRCGALRLAERARSELAATGARPRRERNTGRDALTPSELRVASMAAEGRTSPEIAQALFVTTRTITTHLTHIYAKLDITSRQQISAALARDNPR